MENLPEIPWRDTPPPAGGIEHRKRVDKLVEDLRKKIQE
jgi:hypothetical protein